jgi:transposase-like protein
MNPYKHAVLTVCTPVEQVPLEEPPVGEFDLGAGLVCPNCGGADPVVDEVNAASVAKCPDCQHQFTPQMESQTRRMVRTLSERRRMRRRAAISAVSGTASGTMTPQKRAEVEREAFDLLGV